MRVLLPKRQESGPEKLRVAPNLILFLQDLNLDWHNRHGYVLDRVAKADENSQLASTCIVRMQVLSPLVLLLFHGRCKMNGGL
jgi:hypothetical protein